MSKKTHRDIVKGWIPYTDEEIERYVSRGIWRNLTSCDLLDRNAELFPDKIGAVDDNSEVTWMELRDRCNRMAIHLKNSGLEYGDLLVLQLTNTLEFLYMFLGLNRIGAIPVMCLPRHRKIEIDYEVGLHEAKGIAVPVGEKYDYVGAVEEIREKHPYLEQFFTAGGEAPPGWSSIEELMKQEVEQKVPEDYFEEFKTDPNDLCMENLTGGTSGVPKGVPWTHNFYVCYSEHCGRALGYTEDSVVLVGTPAGHGVAQVIGICPVLINCATMVLTKKAAAKDLFALIEKHRVTHAPLMGIHLLYFRDAGDLADNFDLSSFKTLALGGQKLSPDLVKWAFEDFGVNLVHLFGMTEGCGIFGRWDSPMESQMYSIGKPILLDPDNMVKLVDDNNKEVERGEVGEMVSKGPLTFKGYFRADEDNKKAFDEQGFFHSGDLMSIREDGRIVVEGRKKYMIKRGGENVYPEVVEVMVSSHPKVESCAMAGMPDVGLGEKLCAFVQPVKGETIALDDIKAHLKEKGLAIFQWPERLEIVDGWPLSSSHKINRGYLKAYITTKLFEEGKIDKEYGDWYLKIDKIVIDDVISGKVKIEFMGTPT
jgi:2,3-dihydroxybenzoate-AMP ligase